MIPPYQRYLGGSRLLLVLRRAMLGVHDVVVGRELTFPAPSATVTGLPQFPSAFALGATEPIPNKIGEVSFLHSYFFNLETELSKTRRGDLMKKYYEFTTVHHFGASEYSARFA
jgi:hypothetical protein